MRIFFSNESDYSAGKDVANGHRREARCILREACEARCKLHHAIRSLIDAAQAATPVLPNSTNKPS